MNYFYISTEQHHVLYSFIPHHYTLCTKSKSLVIVNIFQSFQVINMQPHKPNKPEKAKLSLSMPWKHTEEEEEAQLHSFLIWALYGGEWSTSSKKPDELMTNSILECIQRLKHSFNPANNRRLETLYDSKLSL